MIAVLQRVSSAEVTVADSPHHASIGPGLVALVCVEADDSDDMARWMANKIAGLRVFADDDGKFNRSVVDLGGSILLVSQFTLAGDCRKGNRPSFLAAADPERASRLLEMTREVLEETHELTVAVGVFRAQMQVSLVNEGPATFIVQR